MPLLTCLLLSYGTEDGLSNMGSLLLSSDTEILSNASSTSKKEESEPSDRVTEHCLSVGPTWTL